MTKKLISCLVIMTMVFAFSLTIYAESNRSSVITEYTDTLSFSRACTNLSSAQVKLSSLPSGTNRLIARFSEQPSDLDKYDATRVLVHDKIAVMQFKSYSLLASALEALNSREDVLYAEEDFYVSLSGDIQAKNWGIERTGITKYYEFLQHKRLSDNQVVVAVVDSGVQMNHPYFAHSGRVIEGYNLYDSSKMSDNEGHGTHVAGVIAANTPDNIKIQPYKAFDTNSTNLSIVCNALRMAIDNNVDVINMSMSTTVHSDYMHELLDQANNNGIIVVVSAGNNKGDTKYYCPADINSAITVTATKEDNIPDTSYSNYGESCDIAAPGTNIYSTYKNSAYAFLTGTSMAVPFVSSAAALIKSTDKSASFDYVITTLKDAAFVPDGWNTDYGIGILNLYKLVQYVQNVYVPKLTIDYDSFDREITVHGEVHGDESPIVLLCQYDEDKLVDVYISNTPDITYHRYNNDVTSAKVFIWNNEQTMLCSAKEYVF